MNHSLKTALTIGIFTLIGGILVAQSGNDLFQQALVKERTEGNLTEVISLYEKVVQQAGADRKLAAKALYQIGQAYEKLGQAEARKAYERIGREFADQKDVVADAGRRLAALGAPNGSDGQPRRVATPDVGNVTFSLDGRWVTATSWASNGDNHLVVQDTTTGDTKRLLKGSCGDPCTFSHSAILSPDAKQVAFAWHDMTEVEDRSQLRVISHETGAQPTVLVRNREFDVWPCGWSPDSKSILVSLRSATGSLQLGWVSVADGTIKVIKSLEWRLPRGSRVSLSPDGRHIAYATLATAPSREIRSGRNAPPQAALMGWDAPNSTALTHTQICILTADGSSEIAVVKAAGINRDPLWTPDSTRVVFTSNLSGKTDLWSVAIRADDAGNSLVLLRRDIGEISPLGLTSAGTYYFTQTKRSLEHVYIAELTPNGGSRPIESFVGASPSWSPDGKAIAFKRHRPESTGFHLLLRSVETGQELTVSRDSGLAPERWLQSGSALLNVTGPLNDSWYQVTDLKKNTTQRTIPHRPHWAVIAAISPDDKTLYTMGRDPNDEVDVWNRGSLIWDRIVAVDLATGHERQVFRLPGTSETLPRTSGLSVALSPDGRTLAFATTNAKTRETTLSRVNTDGSSHRELYGPYRVSFPVDRLAWTKDGKSIVFAVSAGGRNTKIMRIGSESGRPEYTGLTVDDMFTFDVSPNGSLIAYSTAARPLDSSRGVFAIDNLPALLNGTK